MKTKTHTTKSTDAANQETEGALDGKSCSSKSSTYEKITVVGGVLFVTCIPAAFFFIHPALGFVVTGVMGFLCAKFAIETAKEESDKNDNQ